MELLIFYYIFSVLFMIGYVDWKEVADYSVAMVIGVTLGMLVVAPIMFPINLGSIIGKVDKACP